MTTATRVPVTTDMGGNELDAQDAWRTVRRHGGLALIRDSFLRFRFGDGFTNSRALALQLALAVVPFLLALTGLAARVDDGRLADVIARTVAALTPGSGGGDAIAKALIPARSTATEGAVSVEQASKVALVFGLGFAIMSMITAMAQIERGSNRIYGIRRDRPALIKYGRAALLALVLAIPVGVGFLLLVAGGPLGSAAKTTYGWTAAQSRAWDIARWPVGLVLMTFAIAVLLDHAPRRRQPALSWLALGAAISVGLTMVASGLLALYVHYSGSFGSVYGPLAGVMALLLWCYLSAIALFAGTAVAAQLEALRAGLPQPVIDDPEPARERA